MDTTTALRAIDEASRGPLGRPNPLAMVDCPHCGARLEAMDARAHVLTMDNLCTCCGEAQAYTHGLCPWCIEACRPAAGEHVPYFTYTA